MKVQCEQCSTLFNLQDDKVSEKGTPVKCSRCGHIFVVHPAPSIPRPKPPAEPETSIPAEEPATIPTTEDSTRARPSGISVNDIALRSEEEEIDFRRFTYRSQTIKFLVALIACIAFIVLAFYLYDYARQTAQIWSKVDEQMNKAERMAKEIKAREPEIKAWELYYEAEANVNLGTFEGIDDAQKKLTLALEGNPKLAQAHAAMAEVLARKVLSGKETSSVLEAAKQSADRCVELGPELADGYRALAYCALAGGKTKEALVHLAQALSKSDNDAKSYLLHAKILLSQRKHAQAVDSLKSSLARNPLLFETNFLLAQMEAKRKDWDSAIRYVDKALSISPDNQEAKAAKESYYAMQTGVESSVDTTAPEKQKASITRSPSDQSAPHQLPIMEELNFNTLMKEGKLLHQRGRLLEAIGRYKKALELKPSNCDARTRLGFVYLDQELIDTAKEEFETAIRVSTTCADAYLGLGTIYNELGEHQSAIGNYERYLRLRPTGQDSNEVRSILRYLREER